MVLIVGHRGAPTLASENTLASVERAIEVGADAVEVDVRLSRDGHAMVFHDLDMKRLTGVDAKITELTLEELRKLRVQGREPIPTLEEVLELVKKYGVELLIEVKDPRATPRVLELVKNVGMCSSTYITSFYHSVALEVLRIEPRIRRGLIVVGELVSFGDAIRVTKAHHVANHYNYVTPRFVEAIHRADAKVYAWTVNSVATARRLVELGVDAIVTDMPQVMVREFRG